MKKHLILTTLILLLSIQCLFAANPPKYVFYFIGDGFGVNQAEITNRYSQKFYSKSLAMYSLPNIGIYTTDAANRMITCSAAAGTALATGHKTNINFIGVDTAKMALQSIAEICKLRNMKTGIITSVSIDHATPASFYAKQPNRSMYFEITNDLIISGFNYFAGGEFLNKEKNGVNIEESAKAAGYRFTTTKKELESLKNGDNKIIAYPNRMQDENSMYYSIDQQNEDITLADFTRKGIDVLDNSKGFFIMIEGGKIDWACHANDIASTIGEVINFDNAINVALDFYKKHPKETLIIVCGDHETGGLSYGHSVTKYDTDLSVIKNQTISYEKFSHILKELYNKKGANEVKFNDILKLTEQYFGFNKEINLTEDETIALKKAFEATFIRNKELRKSNEFYTTYGIYDPIAVVATRIIANRAGISWTTFSHTAQPLPIRAIGNGAELFNGFYDNTDIVKKLNHILNTK